MRHIQMLITGLLILGVPVSLAWGKPSAEKNEKEKKVLSRNTMGSPDIAFLKESKGPHPSMIRKPDSLPVYKPPKRGAPGGRVGGGTRGDSDVQLTVYVLAPERIRGLTSQDQPDLYWFLSQPTDVPIEFTLIDEEAINPLIETRLPSPSQAGVQRIRGSDYGIRLSPDKMYRWSIALVLDPDHRSKDILASARIQRALSSEIPNFSIGKPDAIQQTFTHAEAGLWYDAIGAISHAISESPEDNRLHQMRGALLEQVELGEVANFDRTARKTL